MKKKVVIIGGGISGLAAAHRLSELNRRHQFPVEITLLEAESRFGGAIQTIQENGFLFEGGPDSFITEKPWALRLCQSLGLEEALIRTNPRLRRSFIFLKNRLVPVPEGFYLTAPGNLGSLIKTPIFSIPGKLRAAMDLWIPPRQSPEDESIADFIRRRFGREVFEKLGQPMISGIYTADPEKLSLRATMARFETMEREHGSVIRALMQRKKKAQTVQSAESASGPRYSLFLSLRGGLGQLVETLLQKSEGVHFRHSSPVKKIRKNQEQWAVELLNGEVLPADSVCLALPACRAAEIVADLPGELARDLASIPYESVATVNLVYRREDVPHPLNGFGFVVPQIEKREIVGCTFTSVKFQERVPDEKHILVRAFMGGALHPETFALSDAQMQAKIQKDLRDALQITQPPVYVLVRRYAESMPQYYVGHLEKVKAIENRCLRHRRLYLAGNAYQGIGVPDCIRRGQDVAEKLFSDFTP